MANQDDKSVKDTIIFLLKSTGRENIDTLISWMEQNSFFESPASVNYHNAFKGGLAKHSLDVYYEAIKLNESKNLPTTSVTLCALLHDICKADQYYIDSDGRPCCDNSKRSKGHGLRSVFIVTRACRLPLNYDEAMAIWWHMGEHEESLKRHPEYREKFKDSQKIELSNLIREADHNAATKANL